MDEKEFIQDVWDVLLGNTQYTNVEEFDKQYRDYFVELDCETKSITLRDDHNEWRLSLQKVWCDETMV